MKLTQMFVIIAITSILSGVFITMLNEQKAYLPNDYNAQDIGFFNKSKDIVLQQQKLYNTSQKIVDLKEGMIIGNLYYAGTGLFQIGNLLISSVTILPQIINNALTIILPYPISEIITTSIFSLLIIMLLFMVFNYIFGRQ